MRIFWLGGVQEKDTFEEMLKNGNTQIAANVTQLNYIEGIEEVTGETVKILNSNFEPSFPKYKKLFIRKRKWERKGKENVDIGFINIPIFKYVIKTIKLRKEARQIVKKELSNNDLNIFFIYAMTTPLMLLVPFLKKKIKKEKYKICLIVPDLPEYMNVNKDKISLLKKNLLELNRKILYKYVKDIDKYVLFAESMADYLEIARENYVVIEGMVNLKEQKTQEEKMYRKHSNYMMYAGGMNEKYGVLNLVKAFHEIKNKKIELLLFGKGDAVDEIQKISKEDNRIKYKGIVDNRKILEMEKNAKLLVNPRPSEEEYTKYSFPSKNMEYMVSGTPLLTTKLYSIPKEYYKYIYTFEKENVKGFKEKIEEILSKSDEELYKKGMEARQFVLNEKNNVVQARKIIKLITD